MRAVSNSRCPDCREGWVCAAPWESWFSRRDDAEAGWLAENGSPAGFTTPSALLEELPDIEEEAECPSCGGTGSITRRPERQHRQAHAA